MTPNPPTPNSRATPRRARAFTLVECVCAITVIAVVAAATTPVITGAASAYTSAATARETMESVTYAMDRCLKILREIPVKSTDATSLDLSQADATALRLADKSGFALSSDTLYLYDSSGGSAPLLRNVTTFKIEYFDQNGTTSTAAATATTWRFNVTIVAGGLELRSAAFARVRGLS